MLARSHYCGHGLTGGVKGVCALGGAHIKVRVYVCAHDIVCLLVVA